MTSPKIYAAIALSLGISLTAQAGNFGINTFTPGSQLSVKGNLAIGSTFNTVAAPVDGAIFQGSVGVGLGNPTSGASPATSVVFALLGDEGIGTSGPRFPLDVVKFGNAAMNVAGTQTANIPTGNGSPMGIPANSIGSVCIYGAGAMVSNTSFVAANYTITASDARLKDIVGVSNPGKDLETLQKIQITDYTMKDPQKMGSGVIKKVIAQQVRSVYPSAVRELGANCPISYLPTVMAVPTAFKMIDGTLQLTFANPADLKLGDKIKILLSKQNSTSELHGVVSAANGKTFSISKLDNNIDGCELFVYGKQVDDLLGVDYDAIAMLNVSATQELAKQNEQLKQKQTEQTAKLSALEAENGKLQTALATIEAQNAKLQAAVADVQALKRAVAAIQIKNDAQPVAFVK